MKKHLLPFVSVLVFIFLILIFLFSSSRISKQNVDAAPPPVSELTYTVLAAGQRSSILTATSGDTTTNHNGSEWYYKTVEGSMGFAKGGDTVTLSRADVETENGEYRLSWHLISGNMDGGFRAGTNTYLNDSYDWHRYIFESDNEPAYYPYGPQTNVATSSLEGWTLCYEGAYGDTVSLSTLWTNCDKAYLLFAGAPIVNNKIDVLKGGSSILNTPGGYQLTNKNVWPQDTLNFSLYKYDGTTPVPWNDYIVYVSNCTFETCESLENPLATPSEWSAGSHISNSSYTVPTAADNRFLAIIEADNETYNGVMDSLEIVYVSHVPESHNISTCSELQAINDGHLSDNYTLTQNIDCEETATWNGGTGFFPIGNPEFRFTGNFFGQGHKISNLHIARDMDFAGLFGVIDDGATVTNLNLYNFDISASDFVGALAGASAGTITNTYSTGSIEGEYFVGGLIGMHEDLNFFLIANSDELVAKNTTFSLVDLAKRVKSLLFKETGKNSYPSTHSYPNRSENTGYLNMRNTGSFKAETAIVIDPIINSHSNATVHGLYTVGGLVGLNGYEGTITGSYATGNVTTGSSVNSYAGGLVGVNIGFIDLSFATGSVTGDSVNSYILGGLAGGNFNMLINSSSFNVGVKIRPDGIISKSYATGSVIGGASVGGFVGDNGGTIQNCFSKGSVSATDNAGGFDGETDGLIFNSYTVGSVTSHVGPRQINNTSSGVHTNDLGANIGSFLGNLYVGGSLTNSFWNTDIPSPGVACGNSDCSADVFGKTTSQMKLQLTFTTALGAGSWDFDNIWYISPSINEGYPFFIQHTDADSISDGEEAQAPNNGDSNNDGTTDNFQSNVASFLNETDNQYTTLEVPNNCIISFVLSDSEAELDLQDVGFRYPGGLIDYVITCSTPGMTAEISIYFYGVVDTNLVLRKFDNGYSTIPGALIEHILIGGNPVTKVTYNITDGGSLDQDNLVNGIIVDPVGIGVNVLGVANTGFGPRESLKN